VVFGRSCTNAPAPFTPSALDTHDAPEPIPDRPSPYAEGYIDMTFAAGYLNLPSPDQNYPIGSVLNPCWAGAAGAVISTSADVARFNEALANGT